MIKIENESVSSISRAIYSARNAMNSWDKSDSDLKKDIVGSNDLALAKRLCNAGTDHRKFMRMIVVYVDVTAPLYWWAEYDTYKVGTVANSCSKMHKLLSKPFEISDFSFDKLLGFRNEIKQFRPKIDEEKEVWKEISDGYDVSNQGRIRHSQKILLGSTHQDGYIFVTIKGKQTPVHRFVAEAFIPNIKNKPEVNHIDGNKMNNAASNLEWVTRSENQKHAIKNGLQPNPVKTYLGKFTAEQREEIKSLANSGAFSRRQLAEKFNVSHTCINDIVNGKYKYIENKNTFEEIAKPLINILNELRDSYFSCESEINKKAIWYSIIQLLPSSYNQRRTLMLNYEVLANIYKSRRNHKLDEWHTFCDWIETLPYSELITGEKK